jgi:RNA polymerase sigma-70 factor, ECF subfamily
MPNLFRIWLPGSINSVIRDSTSLSLLERSKARDPTAWEQLVALYGPLVYYWCRRAQLTPEDRGDIFQEVFRAVASHIANFKREGGSFRGWLLTITQNKIRDHFRRQLAVAPAVGGNEAQDRLLQLPAPADESSDSGATDPERALMHRALQMIRPDFEEQTWQAFWRAVVDGCIAADIAADLCITVNAVYKAKARVLRRLREELGDLID